MAHNTNGRVAPYGTWTSPISAESVAAQSLAAGIEDVILDPVTSHVYYAQNRPEENGRSAVVDAVDRKDLFDSSWDARTLVHEYGGAASIVFAGELYFSHLKDGRVYKSTKGGNPAPITPLKPEHRFADFAIHPDHPDFIVCTLEDHTDPHPARVVTTLALINARTSKVSILVQGADFYACARFSPDGKFLAWQQWHHPDLPWQSGEVFIAPVSVSSDEQALELGAPIYVAGKPGFVSAQDPVWGSNSSLYFLSDISGYHNPWKFTFDPASPGAGIASPILATPLAEEFGAPQWWLSRHGVGALSESAAAFLAFRKARSVLYVIDITSGKLTEIPTPYAHIQYMHGDAKGRVVILGQPDNAGEELAELSLSSEGTPVLRPLLPHSSGADDSSLPSSFISTGKYFSLTLPPDNRTSHVTYYAPHNPNYDGGVPGEKPPVVVLIHGGPYYMESANLNWSKQFFTSRGWAYIDVNYGGSTGFGRAFRESLHGKWGVLDVQDAHESVLALDKLGLVDANRAVVHGGSAGGYSTLQIATTLPTAFAAGAPAYGISDMRRLDAILHKQEHHLCPRLMGGTYEERPEVWHARSPIYHADKIKMPLLFLQGEKDTVVPADQMVNMVQIIKDRGGKVELVLFPEESHGWRQARTVQTVLERELAFFSEVLGLQDTPEGRCA